MEGIISIAKYKAIKNEEKVIERTARLAEMEYKYIQDNFPASPSAEQGMDLIATGAKMMLAILEENRELAEREEQSEARFWEKYKDVFANAPDFPKARIQYFCKILKKLIQDMQSDDEKKRVDAENDFDLVYMEGVSHAMSQWFSISKSAGELYEKAGDEYSQAEADRIRGDVFRVSIEILNGIIYDENNECFFQNLFYLYDVYNGICDSLLPEEISTIYN